MPNLGEDKVYRVQMVSSRMSILFNFGLIILLVALFGAITYLQNTNSEKNENRPFETTVRLPASSEFDAQYDSFDRIVLTAKNEDHTEYRIFSQDSGKLIGTFRVERE